MYGDILNLNPLLWSRLLVHSDLLYVVQDVPALQDLAKHGILSIQMRSWCKGNEKLRSIRIGAFVRHAQNAPSIVPQRRPDFVFEQLVRGVVDGSRCLVFGVGCRRAGLYHEGGNHAVKGRGIVEARSA